MKSKVSFAQYKSTEVESEEPPQYVPFTDWLADLDRRARQQLGLGAEWQRVEISRDWDDWGPICLATYERWCSKEGYVFWPDAVAQVVGSRVLIKRGDTTLAVYEVSSNRPSRVKPAGDHYHHVKKEMI
jgi:hypothetical protein